MTQETDTDEFSNIITPPDLAPSFGHSVVLIDPEWSEVEDIFFFLKTSNKTFNVFVYRSEMADEDWLRSVIKKSTAIVVNTISNSSSKVKDELAVKQNAWHYGEKRFLMSQERRIARPIDYFAQLT